jgi:DNA-binding NarL/FixJ family response regulator
MDQADSPDLLDDALAYVERYDGDVLQIELERGPLTRALALAWRRDDHCAVIRLVAGLAQIAGRFRSFAEAERVLRMGIEASRRTGDRLALARFLNRLGGLLQARGRFAEGGQLWHASLALAGSPASALAVWDPIASFAHIADILHGPGLAIAFAETVQRTRGDDPAALAVALFLRGFYSRVVGNSDAASADLSQAASLLAGVLAHGAHPATGGHGQRQLFAMALQAELVRAQSDYIRARVRAEAAIALARVYSDPYTTAALLVDQGLFAFEQRQFGDVRRVIRRLRAIAPRLDAPIAVNCGRFLEQQLPAPLPAARQTLPRPRDERNAPHAAPHPGEPLTERERDVLRLVAEGLPNREIALRLVVTVATVKKHLEHIYAKLGVHSRTAALAVAGALHLPAQ